MIISPSLIDLFQSLNLLLEKLNNRKETFIKEDASPVTIADLSVQILINRWIRKHYPSDQIISEEKSDYISDSDKTILLSFFSEQIDLSNDQTIFSDLDYSGNKNSDYCWFIDPIDGTKGYLRGEQFAIAVARYNGANHCETAFLLCPNLPYPDLTSSETGTLFLLSESGTVSQHSLKSLETYQDLSGLTSGNPALAKSVEKAHGNSSKTEEIARQLNLNVIEMDSQVKYGLLLRGEASVYLRLPSEKPYYEKTWDHAAGKALLDSLNGTVTDTKGNAISIRKNQTLESPNGIVASINFNHNSIIAEINKAFI